MTSKRKYHQIIEELENLIQQNNWTNDFNTAIHSAYLKKLPLIEHVATLVSVFTLDE